MPHTLKTTAGHSDSGYCAEGVGGELFLSQLSEAAASSCIPPLQKFWIIDWEKLRIICRHKQPRSALTTVTNTHCFEMKSLLVLFVVDDVLSVSAVTLFGSTSKNCLIVGVVHQQIK